MNNERKVDIKTDKNGDEYILYKSDGYTETRVYKHKKNEWGTGVFEVSV